MNIPGSSRQSGGGMIYFLLLAAVLGFVAVGLQRKSQQDVSMLRSERLKSVRETIFRRVNGFAASEEAIRLTFLKAVADNTNKDLVACLSSGGACAAKAPNALGEFSLFHPQDPGAISGMTGSTVAYDLNGEPCTGRSCAFEARSFFLGQLSDWAGDLCSWRKAMDSDPDSLYRH